MLFLFSCFHCSSWSFCTFRKSLDCRKGSASGTPAMMSCPVSSLLRPALTSHCGRTRNLIDFFSFFLWFGPRHQQKREINVCFCHHQPPKSVQWAWSVSAFAAVAECVGFGKAPLDVTAAPSISLFYCYCSIAVTYMFSMLLKPTSQASPQTHTLSVACFYS